MENNYSNGTGTLLYNKEKHIYHLVLKLPTEEQDKLYKNEELNKAQRSRKFYLTLKKRNEEKSTSIPKVTERWRTHCIDLKNIEQYDTSEIDEGSTHDNSTNGKTGMDTNADESTNADAKIENVDIEDTYTKLGKDDDTVGKIVQYLNKPSENIENKSDYSYRIYEIAEKWFDKETRDRYKPPEKSRIRVWWDRFFLGAWLGVIVPLTVGKFFASGALIKLGEYLEDWGSTFSRTKLLCANYDNTFYVFGDGIFCMTGLLSILNIVVTLMALCDKSIKEKRAFKIFEAISSVFALTMTGFYLGRTIASTVAQGFGSVISGFAPCYIFVFSVLGFAFSLANFGLRIKDKVELSRFNKPSKLNKSNENNNGEQFVVIGKANLVMT